jgi:hypothetical protein
MPAHIQSSWVTVVSGDKLLAQLTALTVFRQVSERSKRMVEAEAVRTEGAKLHTPVGQGVVLPEGSIQPVVQPSKQQADVETPAEPIQADLTFPLLAAVVPVVQVQTHRHRELRQLLEDQGIL